MTAGGDVTEMQRIAANHRLIADLLDALPADIETPTHFNADRLYAEPSVQWLIFGRDEADQRARAAAIIRAIGGKWDKNNRSDLFTFSTAHPLGVKLEVTVDREQVCIARVVGQETVTKQIPTAFEEVTETVDVVEWDCAPLLAAASSGGDVA